MEKILPKTIENVIKAQFGEQITNIGWTRINDHDVDDELIWLVTFNPYPEGVRAKFIMRYLPDFEIQFYQTVPLVKELVEGLVTIACAVCNTEQLFHKLEELMEKGWYPEAWLGDEQLEPICDECMGDYTTETNDGATLIDPDKILYACAPVRNKDARDLINHLYNSDFIKKFWPHYYDKMADEVERKVGDSDGQKTQLDENKPE